MLDGKGLQQGGGPSPMPRETLSPELDGGGGEEGVRHRSSTSPSMSPVSQRRSSLLNKPLRRLPIEQGSLSRTGSRNTQGSGAGPVDMALYSAKLGSTSSLSGGGGEGGDDRLSWVEDRVCSALMTAPEDFRSMMQTRDAKIAMASFLDDASCPKIFFFLELRNPEASNGYSAPGISDPVSEGGRAARPGSALSGPSNGMELSLELPGGLTSDRKCVCLVKTRDARVSFGDPGLDVMLMEISHGTLRHLLHVCRDALFPLLSLPQNKRGLTSSAVKEFAFACEEFACGLEILCGKIDGDIILPLPTTFEPTADPHHVATQREEVRMLESSVLAWVKQIRQTLAKDPEEKMNATKDPWPSCVLDFWSEHSRDLKCILQQVHEDSTRKVFAILKLCHSSYCGPLQRATEDVERSAKESVSNTVFLETLRPYILPLEDLDAPFDSRAPPHHESVAIPSESMTLEDSAKGTLLKPKGQLLPPGPASNDSNLSSAQSTPMSSTMAGATPVSAAVSIPKATSRLPLDSPPVKAAPKQASFLASLGPAMHMIYLITRHSPYYNTPQCLSVLVRSLCNVTITRARTHILGGQGNGVLLKDFQQVQGRVRCVIETCEGFKRMYDMYEHREGPGSEAWKSKHSVLFGRLDAFVERCQDLLHITQHGALFDIFQTVELGGTNGQKNSLSARQLHADMQAALLEFAHVPYDVTDMEASNFEWDFSAFCSSLKGLELRVLGLLTKAFDDCHQLVQAAQLFSSFGPLLDGDTFRGQVDLMASQAMSWYLEDLVRVQAEFVQVSMSSDPPVLDNFPPVAGRLTWSRELLQRIQLPIKLVAQIRSDMLQADGGAEAVERCKSLTFALKRFDEVTFSAWSDGVHGISHRSLRQRLLRREDSGLLCVNLDNSVTAVFRETKYLLAMGFELPSHVSSLYERSEGMRVQAAKLESVVTMHNHVVLELNHAEKRIERKRIGELESTLDRGISELTWQSHGVDDFIETTAQMVQRVHAIVVKMKNNVAEVKSVLKGWGSKRLFTRHLQRTYSPEDFQSFHTKGIEARYVVVREGAVRIQEIVEKTMHLCGSNWTMPEWNQYVEHIRGTVAIWLRGYVRQNLEYMCEHLEFDEKKWNGNGLRLVPVPLLEVKMLLSDKEVVFQPALSRAKAPGDISLSVSGPDMGSPIMAYDGTGRRASATATGSDAAEKSDKKDMSFEMSYERSMQAAAGSDKHKLIPIQEQVKGWLLSILDVAEYASHSLDDVDYSPVLRDDPEIRNVVQRLNTALLESRTACYQFARTFNRFSFLWLSDPKETFQKFLATHGQPEGEMFPRLELFALKIQEMEALLRDCENISDVQSVRWLRLDVRPVKVVVSQLISEWSLMYTEFLYDFFSKMLKDIHEFITKTHHALEQSVDVNSGNDLMLPAVLTSNRAIRHKRVQVEHSFQPLEDVADFLSSHGKPVPREQMDQVSSLVVAWAELQKFALQIKDKFAPFIALDVEQLWVRTKLFAEGETKMVRSIESAAFWSYDTTEEIAYEQLTGMYKEVSKKKLERDAIIELADLLEVPMTHDFTPLVTSETTLREVKHLWDAIAVVRSTFEVFRTTQWPSVDCQAFEEATTEIRKSLEDLPESPRMCSAFQGLLAEVENMIATLPLVDLMRDEAIRHRHWKQLMEISGVTITVDRTMPLDDVLMLPFSQMGDDVSEITANATKELVIEKMMKSIEDAWSKRVIEYEAHDPTGVPMVASSTHELIRDLQEEQVVLQGLLQHRTVTFFYETVIEWQTKLALCETVARLALSVQSAWARIQFLFVNDVDIRTSLGNMADVFHSTQNEFKYAMAEMKAEPNVLTTCGSHIVHDKMEGLAEQFFKCERALAKWLQVKRQRFPRFYFLSDAELAVIMSSGPVSPKMLTRYLYRIIKGANSLIYATRLTASGNEVLGILSADDESVMFEEEVGFQSHGMADMCVWFNDLVQKMQQAMESALFNATRRADGSFSVQDEVIKESVQIDAVVQNVMWTSEVESSMDLIEMGESKSLFKYLKRIVLQIDHHLVDALVEATISEKRVVRRRLQSRLLIKIQHRDLVAFLIGRQDDEKEITANGRMSFAWQSQVRYQLRIAGPSVPGKKGGEEDVPLQKRGNSCRVFMGDCTIDYAFEYLGGTEPVFVVTPQTNRMFLSFAHAHKSFMAVSLPAIPNGCRGRTETCRQMGRALGKPMWSFACSSYSSPDAIIMRLAGISQTTGAFLFLERFDTLPLDIFSIAANAIKDVIVGIRTMLRHEEGSAHGPLHITDQCFLGDINVQITTGTGLFLSFSPHQDTASHPIDLAGVARPVAVPSPDLQVVFGTLLLAGGFRLHAPLARRVTVLLRLVSNMLPSERHYTFGLRLTCSIARASVATHRAKPKESERGIVCQAVRHHLSAMLQPRDSPAAMQIIDQLLKAPGDEKPKRRATVSETRPLLTRQNMKARDLLQQTVKLHRHAGEPGDSTDLFRRKAMEIAASEKGLQCTETFMDRLFQLESVMHVHNAMFVIGPVGAGKSEVWRTLARAGLGGKRVKWCAFNPNALPASNLCGCKGPNGEWIPGAVATVCREFAEMASFDAHRWIVLDGEAVPDWLGPLATALDGEQRQLALETGECVTLGRGVRTLMESASLEHASPASISRCGIVYINTQVAGASAMVATWLSTLQRQSLRAGFAPLFELMLPKLESFAKGPGLRFFAPTSSVACCASMLRLLDGIIESEGLSGRHDARACEMMCSFAAVWGYGGGLAVDRVLNGRRVFHEWWIESIGTFGGEKIRDVGTVFDFYFDLEMGAMRSWADLVSGTKFAGKSNIAEIVVSTPTQVATSRLLSLHGTASAAIVVGDAGVGKTSAVLEHLKVLPNTHTYTRITMHKYADSAYLQAKMRESLVKKAGKVIGPPGTRRAVFFIDDLNMPDPDQNGVQSAAALLLQRITYGIWYERDELTRNEVVNVHFTAASRPSYGARSLDPRLMRHFTIIGCCPPDEGELLGIFTSIMGSLLQRFEVGTRDIIEPLAASTSYAFERISQRFLGARDAVQCTFSLHDINHLIKGLSRATPEFYGKAESILSLWVYECERILCDRLQSEVDAAVVARILRESLHRFVDAWEGVTDPIRQVLHTAFRPEEPQANMHAVDPSVGTLSPVTSMEKLKSQLEGKLQSYSTTLPALDMVLWDQIVYHIIRCTRVFTAPQGHIVLSGAPGLGKSSIIRLAAFVSGHQTVTSSLNADYGLSDFRRDLEGVLRLAGVSGQEIVFLLNDWEIADQRFLVLLHEVMHGGPAWRLCGEAGEKDEFALFSEKARVDIARQWLHRENSDERLDDEGPESAWRDFLNASQARLHVALCLQPKTLQKLGTTFPAILRKCYIDVIRPWESQAMIDLAELRLSEFSKGQAESRRSAKMRYSVVHHSVFAHKAATEVLHQFGKDKGDDYVPSCSKFPVFLQYFSGLLLERRHKLTSEITKIEGALKKVHDIVEEAKHLKDTRDEVEQEIAKKTKIVEGLLIDVGQKARELEAGAIAIKEAEVVRADADKVLESARQDISVALSMAKPVLADATKALKSMDKMDLARVKAYTSPPALVEAVLAATLIIASPADRLASDVSWTKAKRSMSSIDRFVIELLQIDKENIPSGHIAAVQPYISQSTFTPDNVSPISGAVASLCEWVLNVVEYNRIHVQFMIPKQEALKVAQGSLSLATQQKDAEEAIVKRLEQERVNLTALFEAASAEKNKFSKVFEEAQGMHQRAAKLASAVTTQGERLESRLKDLKRQSECVIGDCLLGAMLVTHAGPLDQDGRATLIHKVMVDLQEKHISYSPATETYELLCYKHFACDLHIKGLPQGYYEVVNGRNVENACIAMESSRCTLFLDPDGLAQQWMKSKAAEKQAIIVHARKKGYMNTVKAAVGNGSLVVVELDGDNVDLILASLLSLRTLKKGKKNFLWVGSEFVECTSVGKIFLRTEFDRPDLPLHIRATSTVVNFQVQESATQDLLLAVVVAAAEPPDEVNRVELHRSVLNSVCILETLQTRVLDLISDVDGSKATSDEARVTIIHQAATEVETEHSKLSQGIIALERQRGLAWETHGDSAQSLCELWRIVRGLQGCSPSYVFSLWAACRLVYRAVRSTATRKRHEQAATEQEVTECARRTMENFVIAGLLTKHRLPFVVLSRMIQLVHEGKMTAPQLDAFLSPTPLDSHKSHQPAEFSVSASPTLTLDIASTTPPRTPSTGSLTRTPSLGHMLAKRTESTGIEAPLKKLQSPLGDEKRRRRSSQVEDLWESINAPKDRPPSTGSLRKSSSTAIDVPESPKATGRMESSIAGTPKMTPKVRGSILGDDIMQAAGLTPSRAPSQSTPVVPPTPASTSSYIEPSGDPREFFRTANKPDFLTDETWSRVVSTSRMFPSLKSLPGDLRHSARGFKSWLKARRPEELPLPLTRSHQDGADVTPLEKLFVIRALRPDRLPAALATTFPGSPGIEPDLAGGYMFQAVTDVMSLKVEEEEENPALGLGTYGIVPILVTVTPDYDPTDDIKTLAEESDRGMQYGEEVVQIHAAAGGVIAAVDHACSTGGWLVISDLGNNHDLAMDLYVRLSELSVKLLSGPSNTQVHRKARIFILSAPEPAVPACLCRVCLKVGDALPVGVHSKHARFLQAADLSGDIVTTSLDDKKTQHRTLEGDGESAPKHVTSVERAIQAACLLHCVCSQRGTAGTRGWGGAGGVPLGLHDLLFARERINAIWSERGKQMDNFPYEETLFSVGSSVYGGIAVDERDHALVELLSKLAFQGQLQHDPLSQLKLPPLGEVYIGDKTRLPDDAEPMGSFMPALWELLGIVPKEETWAARQEMLSDVLEDLTDSLPASEVDLKMLKASCEVLERVSNAPAHERMKLAGEDAFKPWFTAIVTFLRLVIDEVSVLNTLLMEVHHTLQDCEAALLLGSTFCLSSDSVQESAHALLEGRVPRHWTDLLPSSLPLSGWVADLRERFQQFEAWASCPPETFPLVWLPGFRRPRSVIAAAQIFISKRDNIPLQRLSVVLSPSEYEEASWAPLTPPPEEVLLHGIFVHGATWDARTSSFVQTPHPQALASTLPVLGMHLVPLSDAEALEAAQEDKLLGMSGDGNETPMGLMHATEDQEDAESGNGSPGGSGNVKRWRRADAAEGSSPKGAAAGESLGRGKSRKSLGNPLLAGAMEDTHTGSGSPQALLALAREKRRDGPNPGTAGTIPLPLFESADVRGSFVCTIPFDAATPGADETQFLLGGVALLLKQLEPKDLATEKPQAGSFYDVSGPPISSSFIKSRMGSGKLL